MNLALWIIAGLLAAVFLLAGAGKVTQSKAQHAARPNMEWVETFAPGTIKFIGVAELLAAVGLILPAALDILPILTPLAATGLVALMIGAATVHGRRKESHSVGINIALLALAAFVAWGRFGPYAF